MSSLNSSYCNSCKMNCIWYAHLVYMSAHSYSDCNACFSSLQPEPCLGEEGATNRVLKMIKYEWAITEQQNSLKRLCTCMKDNFFSPCFSSFQEGSWGSFVSGWEDEAQLGLAGWGGEISLWRHHIHANNIKATRQHAHNLGKKCYSRYIH